MEEEYKYNCVECNYHTNNRSYWYQHKKTKKHIKNTNDEVLIYKYNCNLCDYHTENRSSWYRHHKSQKHIKNQLNEDNRLEQVEIQNQKEKEERELNIKEEEIKLKKEELQLKRLQEDRLNKELELKEKELNKQTIINNDNSITDNSITNNTINISVYNNESIVPMLDKDSFNDMIDFIKEINDNKKDTDYYSMIKYYLYKSFIECPTNNTIQYNNMRGDVCKVHMGNNQWKAKSIQNVLKERIEKIPNFISKISYTAPMIFNDLFIPTTMDEYDEQCIEDKIQIRDFKTKHKDDYQLIKDTKITMKNICENYNNTHNKKLNTIKRQHSIDIYNQ